MILSPLDKRRSIGLTEAARALGIPPRTLRRHAAEGAIPGAFRIGTRRSHWRFRTDMLEFRPPGQRRHEIDTRGICSRRFALPPWMGTSTKASDRPLFAPASLASAMPGILAVATLKGKETTSSSPAL
jgi:hypothetical protein